mmetsp:Transcript_31498/g.78005  ORF Transcript_31498/g.78005 Transcript_31498/m.78005 type:complete len:211 (+) Transcript_31498:883-1515(+)
MGYQSVSHPLTHPLIVLGQQILIRRTDKHITSPPQLPSIMSCLSICLSVCVSVCACMSQRRLRLPASQMGASLLLFFFFTTLLKAPVIDAVRDFFFPLSWPDPGSSATVSPCSCSSPSSSSSSFFFFLFFSFFSSSLRSFASAFSCFSVHFFCSLYFFSVRSVKRATDAPLSLRRLLSFSKNPLRRCVLNTLMSGLRYFHSAPLTLRQSR